MVHPDLEALEGLDSKCSNFLLIVKYGRMQKKSGRI